MKKALKKTLYLFLAAAHLFVFGPAREACALAFSAQSASFGLTAGSFSDGARNRVGIYAYTKLLLHADGADGAQSLTDEKGNAVAVVGGAQIDAGESKFGGSGVYFPSGSNALAGGVASADSEYIPGDYDAANVVDGNEANTWSSADTAMPHWWKYDFGPGASKSVRQIRIKPANTYGNAGIKNFTLQGSSNDADWMTLYTGQAANSENWQEFSFENQTAYRYYKINILDNWGGSNYGTFYEIEMREGAAGYLTVPDAADWDFGAGDFTIDFWLRGHDFSSPDSDQGLIDIGGYQNGVFIFSQAGGSNIYVYIKNAYYVFPAVLSSRTWYHVAVVRDGTQLKCFLNGTQTGATQTNNSDIVGLVSGVTIGNMQHVDKVFNGWMDEIRISKGVARWSANFTPPAAPYSLDSEFIPSSNRLAQDAMGEAVVGRAASAGFILEAGYIAMTKPNPPVQTQVIPNQTWQENASKMGALDLDNYFLSPDGYALTYSVSGSANITVFIEPSINKVSFTAAQGWSGTEKVKFTATDTEGNSIASNEVTLQVQGVDNAPVLQFIPDISVNEGDLVAIAPRATDLDGDAVTFTFSAPLGVGGQWQTDYSSAGLWTVLVTATDATGLSASQNVRVNVRNVNRPPALVPLADVAGNEGDLIALAPVVSDPDGEALSVYFSAPLDSAGKWLTGYSDAGSYIVTVTVSDGIDTASQSVNITVNNVNRAPEAALTLSAATAAPGEAIMLALSATDPDGDAVTYSVTKDSGLAASGALTAPVSLSLSFSSVGDHVLTATVTDSGGLATTKTLWVDVVDPNQNKYAVNPVMGDFNGDSLTDLGLHDSDTGKWEVALSSSGVFTAALDWLTAFGASRYWQPVGGDFNGDARSDAAVYNTSTGELKVALSNGSAFSDSGIWLIFSGAGASWQPFTGNFNGDKYTDFALYNKDSGEVRAALGTGTGFGAFAAWRNAAELGYQVMGGDFNGDGLTDLGLFWKSAGELKVVLSDSKAFVEASVWISGFAQNIDPILSDFNHDGLTDVGYWEASSGAWQYAISTGNRFSSKGAWLVPFGSSADDMATTGDFNGDGLTDRALFDRDSLGINRWKTQSNALKPCDLLIEVANGTGGKTKVTYAYAASGDNPSLPFPVYVASSISLIDTLPADKPQETYTQNFAFAGGAYDSGEREFRGFAKVAVTDPVTGNRTETYFYQGLSGLNQDGALKGQIQKMIAYDGNSRKISEAVNTYDVRKAGPSDRVLGFPALVEQTTTVTEENGTLLSTKDRMTYDNIGNVTEAFSDGDIAKTGDEKSTATIYALSYTAGFNRPLEVSLRDKDGSTVSKKTFEYDLKGNLTKEKVYIFNPFSVDSGLSTVDYAYDSFGNLLSSTNALGRTTTTEYETTFYAYPQKVTNALGHTVTYVYDSKFGAVLSATDPNGLTTLTDYDSFGRPTRKGVSYDLATGDLVTYAYPDFNTKITTNAIGFSSTEYADGLGRKYKTVSPGEDGGSARAVSTEAAYNARGLIESESVAHYIDEASSNIAYVRYEYDLRGRLTKTRSDFPGTIKDAEASVAYINPLYTETTDPEGRKKGTLKDVYGSVVEVTEFTSSGVFKTAYAYDLQGNLIKTTDSQNNVTQIWYDSIGRKLKMSDPDMGVWTYDYDALGNLIKQTDAKAQVLTFEYDALNRLTCKLANAQTLVTYLYDDQTKTNAVGRLSKVTDLSGSTEFFYDSLGREIKSVKTADSTPYTVHREYDILDRLTKLTYPDGESVTYSYDPNSGLLEKVTGSPANPQTYVSDITYTASGQIKTIQYGNGTRTDYTYGQDLRLSRILTSTSASTLQDLNYLFDKNGNITTLTDNLRSNIRTYAYDDLDRLTQASNIPNPPEKGGGYAAFNYQYDSIGNMTYKSDLGVMTYGSGITNGAGPHAVTSAGGISYQYDGNGNMVVGKNKTLEYDAENRIIKITQSDAITTFTYDGDGGRVKKSSSSASTTYIGSLFEIQKSDSSAGMTQETLKHIFAGSQRVCSVNQPIGSPAKAQTSYYHSDHLGSSSIITDGSGIQLARYEYTPYGALAVNEPANPQTGSAAHHLFTGKELDSTGLYFYGARYYDPDLGRFITPDTIVQAPYDPQSLNRYAYCRNNPLNYVDPTGHWFWAAIIAIGKAIAAAAAAHPIIAGAAMGGILGGVNSAVSGQNIGMGIGMGMFTGALGGAVGMGVGGFLKDGIGGFWSGMAGAGFGGAAAGAAGAGVLGGDAGMGALTGFAGGVAGFLGSYKTAPLAGYMLGDVASTAVAGGDLGEAATRGLINGSVAGAIGMMLPDKTIGEQGAAGAGDLIFYRGGGLLDAAWWFLTGIQGAPIGHVAIATRDGYQVDSHVRGGVKERKIDFSRQGRIVKWAGSGKKSFIALATQYGKDNAFKYWLGPGREVCSTFVSRVARETGLAVPGFSPSSQYNNLQGIPYVPILGVQEQ